jgi:molybdenum cofactor biosynthesis enzyme
VQVGADEQRQRDAQARALLLAEKQRVQAVLQNARKGGDAAQVALTEADLASIERELARLP